MEPPKRKPLRLQGWDYSGAGYYFITACTKERRCLLSSVGRGILDASLVELTEYGKLVEETLSFLDTHSEYIRIDKHVIMPNHIHLILDVDGDGASGKPRPTDGLVPKFMSSMKRYTNKKAGQDLWQTSYYDHIIRSEADYLRIWNYIDTNPAKWPEDEYYHQEKR